MTSRTQPSRVWHWTALAFCFLLLSPILVRAAPASVPSWFISDSGDPGAIFSAWKSLSTRDAALYLGAGWTVLGGQLVDEQGRPLGLTRVSLSYSEAIRSYGADLVTDKDGYFLIYGPYSLEVSESEDDHRQFGVCRFYVAPGYPLTVLGARYAVEKKDIKSARAQLLFREAEKAFYRLTVDGHSSFNKEEFDSYRADNAGTSQLAATAPVRVARPFRDRPRPREGSVESRKPTTYKLRIVAADGTAVPHALVKFQAYDGYEGNYQVVEGDEKGLCEVVEYLLDDQDHAYYANIQRQITVDTPSVTGPVSISLDKNTLNTLTLSQPAKVSGRLSDHHGDPIYTHLSVSYKRANLIAFELDMPVSSNGEYFCDRIMPGEEFRIVTAGSSRQSTPRAPAASDYLSLSPGAERLVNLQVPQAAALRILLVDHREQLVNAEVTLRSVSDVQMSNVQQSVGKFGFFALGEEAFRIHIQAKGFDDYVSDPIQLEPGELRFIRIVLTPRPKD